MPGTDRDEAVEADFDEYEYEYEDDDQWRAVHSDDARAGRRYRPGRGGFDPEAAALAARTKYARRQRTVLIMLLAVVTTALLAALLLTALWWLHVLVDLALVGYLAYLRRQVRIEEEIRSRRLARMSGRDDLRDEEVDEYDDLDEDQPEYELDEFEELEDDRRLPGRFADAVVVDIDDEDPMFDELDERTWEPYRRAVGE